MTEPGGQEGGRRRAKAQSDAKPGDEKSSGRADNAEADAIAALNHEVRREILRLLHDPDGPRSPVRTAETLNHPLSSVSYHFRVLSFRRAIAQVKEAPVRGAMEHFYVSKVANDPAVLGMLERTHQADERLLRRDAGS
jgi:Helix-turn-helix domain